MLALLALPALAVPSLNDGYRAMYNLDFPGAHRAFAAYQRLHPGDPMGPVSDAAAYLFGEFDRLHILQAEFFVRDEHFITDHRLTPDPELRRRFDDALDVTRRLAAQSPSSESAMLAGVLETGLQADYMALIEKRYLPSLREMMAARERAEQLLARYPACGDAWLAVGVENYMLGIRPAPLRLLLRLGGAQTDRAAGLVKLELTAEKGTYLAPFARLMLAAAALRDGRREQAAGMLRGLSREYPGNPLYTQELARLEKPGVRP
jgi:hypothetical protein